MTTTDKNDDVTPMESIRALGKGLEAGKNPFSIVGRRGLYFYVPAGQFGMLQRINEAAGKDGLPAINVVGRGGASGNRPFLLKGNFYVCVLAEHIRRLEELTVLIRTVGGQEAAKAEGEEERPVAEEETTGIGEPVGAPPGKVEGAVIVAGEGETTIIGEPVGTQQRQLAVEKEGAAPAAVEEDEEDAGSVGQEALATTTTTATTTEKAPAGESAQQQQQQQQTGIVAESEPRAIITEKAAGAAALPPEREAEKSPAGKEEGAGTKGEGKYVYCFIKADGKTKTFGEIGIGSREVYCLNHGKIAAVVSDSPGGECEFSAENARAHNGVISQVMNGHTVLPVGFGCVFANRQILEGVLDKAHDTLKKELKRIKNKVELGVKVIAAAGNGNEEPAKECASEALESLGKLAVRTHKGDLFTKRLVLNASFLVDKNRVSEFTERVLELEKKYRQSAMKLNYTGPWPPYNFVNIRIGA